MKRLPDAMVVIDAVHDHSAVAEAKRTKIPIIALADTNTDPRLIQYPIPSNDDARLAVEYMTGRMAAALDAGKLEAERTALLAKAEKEKQDKESQEKEAKEEAV